MDLLITALLVACYGALLLFLGWWLHRRRMRLLWASHRELAAFQEMQERRVQRQSERLSRLEGGVGATDHASQEVPQRPAGFTGQQRGGSFSGPGGVRPGGEGPAGC